MTDTVDSTPVSKDVALTRDGDVFLGDVDGRELPLSTTIVCAVAEVQGEDPLDLSPPLSSIVDPDALDQLFRQGPNTSFSVVTFTVWGCRVTIKPPESIRIERI